MDPIEDNDLSKLIFFNPETAGNNDTVKIKDRKEEKYKEAVSLLEKNKKKDAKKILLGILSEYPNHKPSIKLLAENYMENRQSERAIKVLADFLEKNPSDDEFLNLIGTYLDNIGEIILAKSFMEKSLSISPHIEIVKNNLDTINKRIQKQKKAKISARYLYLKKILQKEDHKPTIALCMIIKNEENNLADCLDSAKDLVDEIIITDTGSTDRSIEIAQKYGAEIRHFKWNNDFSAARNESIRDVKSDWILILDADETLESKGDSFFRQLPNENVPRVYLAKNLNILSEEDEKNYIEHYNRRFFKNKTGIHYIGSIHEQLVCKTREILEQSLSDIVIKHKGYSKKIVQEKNKNERNIKILRESIESEPDNAFNYYNLGIQYYTMFDYENAVKSFKDSIKKHNGTKSSYLPFCYSSISEALFKIGKYSESADYALKALEIAPNFSNAYFSLAHSYASMGKNEEAIRCFKKAMEPKKDVFLGGTTDNAIFNWKSYNGIGICYMQMEKYEEALAYFKKAYVFEKKSVLLFMNLINAHNNLKEYDGIESLIAHSKDISLSVSQIQQIINILLSAKKNTAAISVLKKFVKEFERKKMLCDAENTRYSLLTKGIADIYFEMKDYQHASAFFEKYLKKTDEGIIGQDSSLHREFFKRYGLSCFYQNEKQKALSMLDRAISLDKKCEDNDWELYFSCGSVNMDLQKYEQAILCFKKAMDLNKYGHSSYIAMAQIYLKIADHDSAEDILSRAIDLDLEKEEDEILFLKAKVLFHQKKYEESIDDLISYIDNGGSKIEAYNDIGLCLHMRKDHDKAIDFFMQAIEKDNSNASYYANLGNALAESGNHEDAKTAYSCALEIDKTNEAALVGIHILEVERKLLKQ